MSNSQAIRSDEIGALEHGAVFVGRVDEMAALNAALAHTIAGYGRVVMLVGEPGIGKTRTAAEFAVPARTAGALVLRGGCYEGEWAPPYGPFVEALTAYVRNSDPEQLRHDLGFGGPVLCRLLPAARERLPDMPEPVALQPDEERFRLFDAVSQFLLAMAKRRVVVLLLDDLHWADKGTVALLRHVARFAPQIRLLLIGTYRDVELEPQHPLTDALGTLYRETACQRIVLQGFDQHEVAQLIADSKVPQKLRGTLAAAIYTATNGNPFFVHEVLRHLIDEGRLEGSMAAKIGIPDSVRQVLTRRVRQLSAETGTLLTVGAAFGGPFHLHIAANVALCDDVAALNAIDQALRAQLVQATDSAERYDFTHALVRDTLYTALSPSRQIRLHRQIASTMERVYGDSVTEHSAEVAYQYARSAALPGSELGVAHALTAADRASADCAYDDTAVFLRMALDLLPVNDTRRPWLAARLGMALSWGLNFDAALPAMCAAGDLIATAHGEGAAADYLAESAWTVASAGFQPGAWTLAARGMQYVREQRDATWVWLMVFDVLRREGEDTSDPGMPLLTAERRAVARVAARLQLTIEQQYFLHYGGFLGLPSPSESTSTSCTIRASVALWTGPYPQRAALWEKEAGRAEQKGQIANAVAWWALVARMRIASGDLPLARIALDCATDLAARLTRPSPQTLQLAAARYEMRLASDEGWEDLLQAEQLIQQPENNWAFTALRAAGANVYARLGGFDAALALLEAVAPALERAPGGFGNYPQIACDAAESLWLLNRDDQCDVIERNMREKVVSTGDLGYPMRDANLALARLCALRGRYLEARAYFARARAVLDQQAARSLRAIVDYDEALMHVRHGDHERARPLLEEALRQFRTIRMTGWIRRAEHLLATREEWSPAIHNDMPQRQQEIVQPETRDQAPQICSLRYEGSVWSITFAGKTHRLKNTRGLRYLAHLFNHPHYNFHVSELSTLSAAAPLHGGPDLGDAGEVLDREAIGQYRRRLTEVNEELSEAERNNDIGRSTQLRQELEILMSELAAAAHGRRGAAQSERARSAVGKRVRDALMQIASADNTLGRYLRATIRTGTFCRYTPDPRLRVECETMSDQR